MIEFVRTKAIGKLVWRGGLLLCWLFVIAAPLSAQDAPVHVVQPGDTLSEIAKSYGVELDQFMALNGILNADTLRVGQELTLPARPDASLAAPVVIDNDSITASEAITYTVRPGDSLSKIAKDFGVTLNALMVANHINNVDRVIVGQVLTVPSPTASVEPVADSVSEVDATTAAESTLALPDSEDDASAAPADATPSLGALEQPAISTLNPRYRVQTGDTLAGIALSFGVDVRALRAINNLADTANADLIAGQELILPATGEELRVIQPTQRYTVASGDSLGFIAKEHGVTLVELMDANGIRNPDLLEVGQELILPPPADAEEVVTPQIGPQRRGFYYYTVQQGDTLSELAKEFDSTMLALLEFNNLPDEETVYSGLQLRIPFGAPPLPQVAPPVPLSGTSFLVSLSRQECWLFEGGQVGHRWTCSTGYGDWITRTGTFNVQTMLEMAQSSAYGLDMPYWLGIYDVGESENGIHGLPIDWETGEEIWDGLIGQPATFGCAMLANEDAAVLFDRAYLGMPIHVLQ
jgi:LysM repeat protein